MIKPKRLKKGDTIAIVSLSWGGLGEPDLIHKYYIAKERLENDFGLHVICMPHALKGSAFISAHPELRAKDFMDALMDKSISAIFSAIGGNDTIRLLPYIDFSVIKDNPKIFLGYSDTTINHLMMYKANVISFYGPSIMCEFGEYGSMFDYTKEAVQHLLFERFDRYQIPSSAIWSSDYTNWEEANRNHTCLLKEESHHYEILNGHGTATGHLLGGCIDVFLMANGTSIWPSLDEWNGSILFIETSEDEPSPSLLLWVLRNLAAQGILKAINGILVGKPYKETYYEEYKEVLLQVIVSEEGLSELPIFYNVNFGHAKPSGILPYGIPAELKCDCKTITLLECPTS